MIISLTDPNFIKCRLIAGTLFLISACNTSLKEKQTPMSAQSTTQNFSLEGKWKLISTGEQNKYLPEFLIFKKNNLYSIEGKEDKFHPILDGGHYEYDTISKVLRINTANDAIKQFRVKEKNGSFALYEDDIMMAEYKKS